MNPPIRLGRVAEEFLIQRRPERSSGSGRGYIEFNKERQRFVIYLNRPSEKSGRAKNAEVAGRLDRFVYAHEFAHRFFFVRVADGWSRALAEVGRGSGAAERLGITRSISTIEERICNGVATRLLVPRRHLELVVREAIGTRGDTEHLLINLLSNVSRRFEVSWWCASRRIAALKPAALVAALGSSFCYILLGRSVQTGAGRGRSTLRVLDFWWPEDVAGEPIRPAFPGLRLSYLGETFEQRANALEGHDRIQEEICWPIRLISKRREPVQGILRGFCRTWSLAVERRYLVYGIVRPD